MGDEEVCSIVMSDFYGSCGHINYRDLVRVYSLIESLSLSGMSKSAHAASPFKQGIYSNDSPSGSNKSSRISMLIATSVSKQ